MELMVSLNLALLIQPSAFAEEWLVKPVLYGMSFSIFRAFPKI